MYVLGFNHNPEYEGACSIHFQFGFTALRGGYDIAFVDSYYDTCTTKTTSFAMNPATNEASSSNIGGWESCHMRHSILGATGNPSAPGSNTFLAAMPVELREVLKPTEKYTDNQGGDCNIAANVTATTDMLFLLADWEIAGKRTYSNPAEQNYQKQYQYYINGNSVIKMKHTSMSEAPHYWLRSPGNVPSPNIQFCNMWAYSSENVQPSDDSSGYSFGIAPAFVV